MLTIQVLTARSHAQIKKHLRRAFLKRDAIIPNTPMHPHRRSVMERATNKRIPCTFLRSHGRLSHIIVLSKHIRPTRHPQRHIMPRAL